MERYQSRKEVGQVLCDIKIGGNPKEFQILVTFYVYLEYNY